MYIYYLCMYIYDLCMYIYDLCMYICTIIYTYVYIYIYMWYHRSTCFCFLLVFTWCYSNFSHSSKSLIFEARTSQGFSAKEPKLNWQRWLEVNFLSVEEPASRSHVAAHCDGLVLISWSLHLPAAQLRSCGRILLHVMELEFRHDRPAS